MIGKNIFYIDFNSASVKKAFCNGASISSSGYLLYELSSDNKTLAREKAFIFDDKEKANDAFAQLFPYYQQMVKIQEKAKEEIDAIRLKMIGKPDFLNLTKGEIDESN